jgi:hypothetical protein
MHARVTAVAAGDHGREYEPVFRAELRSGDVYGSRLCGATLVKGGAARGTGTERGVAEGRERRRRITGRPGSPLESADGADP